MRTTPCDRFREALSAQLDGEDLAMAGGALDDHLASCAACRAWIVAGAAVTRTLRVQEAEPVPDLSEAILASVRAERDARAGSGAPSVVRLTLALVAVAQAMLALPALLGDDLGAPQHVAHEQGAWALALAAAFALAAWHPARAAAFIPLLAVFVGALLVLGLVDVASGRAAPSGEAPHLMAAFGLVLLWLESRPNWWGRRPAPACA